MVLARRTKDKDEGGKSSSTSPSSSTNFLVMSDAGKPIYTRHGSEEVVSRICGLLQAIRSSTTTIKSDANRTLGDIRSLRSGRLCLVFMNVCSLTLVAIGSNNDTELYLKLQLEYILGQIMFNFSSKVQEYFIHNPSFDLRSMLGNTISVIDKILDDISSTTGSPGHYLLGSVETLYPLSPAIRVRSSSVLQAVGLKTDFTAFSMLAVGEKLITLIQPSFPAHQMRISDLHLLLHVVSRQQATKKSGEELWIPICLPRFSSQDFLFCYTQCFDAASNLTLIMISQQSTSSQFELFRQAASTIRRSLELPSNSESILEILPESSNGQRNGNQGSDFDVDDDDGRYGNDNENLSSPNIGAAIQNDVNWRRSNIVDIDHAEDYVDATDGKTMIPYLSSPSSNGLEDDCGLFLREIRSACIPENLEKTMDKYLSIGSALHFVFRFDVTLQAAKRQGHSGNVSQCVSAPRTLGFPFVKNTSKQKIWNTYMKLRLRLCHGSATTESTMEAFDTTTTRRTSNEGATRSFINPGIDQHCPAKNIVSVSPESTDGIAYLIDGTELYLAMNGPHYEIYLVMSSTATLKEAAESGTKLVRRLLADQRSIFFNPLTWDG